MVLDAWRGYMENPDFKAGIARTFVKAGYLKDSKTGAYQVWAGFGLGRANLTNFRPNRACNVELAANEVGLIGTVFADVDVQPARLGDDDDPDEMDV